MITVLKAQAREADLTPPDSPASSARMRARAPQFSGRGSPVLPSLAHPLDPLEPGSVPTARSQPKLEALRGESLRAVAPPRPAGGNLFLCIRKARGASSGLRSRTATGQRTDYLEHQPHPPPLRPSKLLFFSRVHPSTPRRGGSVFWPRFGGEDRGRQLPGVSLLSVSLFIFFISVLSPPLG